MTTPAKILGICVIWVIESGAVGLTAIALAKGNHPVLFMILTVSVVAAAAVPVGVVGLLDRTGLVALDAVLDLMLSWELLLGTTLLCLGVLAFPRRRA